MRSIDIRKNKTLKLKNVLQRKIQISESEEHLDKAIEEMYSYIKSKGAVAKGSVIKHKKITESDNGIQNAEVTIMIQCDNYIQNTELPYHMEKEICIKNTMYCSYIGPQDNFKLAYDKINIVAFEENVQLYDESYTIFVDSDESDDSVFVKVYVPSYNSDKIYLGNIREYFTLPLIFIGIVMCILKIMEIEAPMWFLIIALIVASVVTITHIREFIITKMHK